MGTGSFPGVQRPGRGADHPPPSSAEVEGRVELYICSSLWAFVACYRETFTFTARNVSTVRSGKTARGLNISLVFSVFTAKPDFLLQANKGQ